MEYAEGGEGMETAVQLRPTEAEQIKEVEKKLETIRPELNIERHADFIFAPSHSKNIGKPRSRTWLEALPDGTKVKASISIATFNGKTPTTRTRKVYLALQKLTEEKGWNDEERTNFSLYEVSQIVGWKWNGKRTIRELRDELLRLRGNLFTWQYSFVDGEGHKVGLLDTFNILEQLKVIEKRDRASNQLFLALSSFRFHEEIRKGLKANRTKPTNLVALQIQGEIALVLYTRLDVLLADKTHYERTSAGLFQDLQLEGDSEYRYPSGRKRKLEKALKELEGKPISTGTLHLTLEKTVDGKDWKLVAHKTPLTSERPPVRIPERVGEANPPEAVPYLIQDLAATIGGLPKNQRFYELIFKTYSADLVYQAISEWKADGGREARNPRGYFTSILHRIAHQRGKLWLFRQCPPYCKYRPDPQPTDPPTATA